MRIPSKTFLLRAKSDWAVVTVAGENALTVMINSAYGNWCFTWTSPGENKIKFLETSDVGYTFGKFTNTYFSPKKIQESEWRKYKMFYELFWPLLIEELKNSPARSGGSK